MVTGAIRGARLKFHRSTLGEPFGMPGGVCLCLRRAHASEAPPPELRFAPFAQPGAAFDEAMIAHRVIRQSQPNLEVATTKPLILFAFERLTCALAWQGAIDYPPVQQTPFVHVA